MNLAAAELGKEMPSLNMIIQTVSETLFVSLPSGPGDYKGHVFSVRQHHQKL